jgi:exodeoxyribonuclease V alpha subunit
MELIGTIKNIIYRNEENGFTVAELLNDEGEEFTAVGPLMLASPGERIEISGEWTAHKVYGSQFKADSCRTLAPSTLGAIINYLSSGLIRGVGESTARSIVQAFGMDTLDVMEKTPDRLTEVSGIGKARAAVIIESYQKQRDMRDVMLALQEYGVTVGQAAKLYKLYGPLCLARIRENPYSLIDDVESIGFMTADKLAFNAGIEHGSPFRIRAGLKYVLSLARREGHTFLPREKLLAAACETLECDLLPVENSLDEMTCETEFLVKYVGGTEAVFLPFLYYIESDCAKRLLRIAEPHVENPFVNLRQELKLLETELDLELAPHQREAVLTSLTKGAAVITGGPGTGKTTILRFIIHLLSKLGMDFELCAPTGRAAKRMTEAAGSEARTIHRLLEYGFGTEGFSKNEDNPILADVVIVDEMSMVDVPLMHSLLRALHPDTRLIMVGDADQLPPVGAGNVLRDIISSGTVPFIRLTEIFRQEEKSLIVANAHRINKGMQPVLDRTDSDFAFLSIEDPEEILIRVIGLCKNASGRLGSYDPLKDIQVLAPMKKGVLGVKNLNERLQAALNPPGRHKNEKIYGDTLFREGDKVMQIKNDYRIEWTRQIKGKAPEDGTGVFNGDIGTVMSIDAELHEMKVLFDDERFVSYDFIQLDELELAYCVSIHKSQGSEFPFILLPLAGGPPMLMTRNLLYTAVTRAKEKVTILGRRQSVAQMVNNNTTRLRYSALSHFLSESASLPGGCRDVR